MLLWETFKVGRVMFLLNKAGHDESHANTLDVGGDDYAQHLEQRGDYYVQPTVEVG